MCGVFLNTVSHFFLKPRPIGQRFLPWKCDNDVGEGVGDMRGSAGCEVVVDGPDRRESFPSNLHYLAGWPHHEDMPLTAVSVRKQIFFLYFFLWMDVSVS